MRCAVGGRRAGCADIYGPKKTLCNRFVRRAERAVYGKVSSALRQVLRIRLTGCSSTAPASRFIAAPAAEKGGLGPFIGRTKGGRNTGLYAVLVAGKGRELRERLEERGTGPVIPPRKNRKIRYHDDQAIYRERDIIERMFCRLKDRRRIATRFERTIKNVTAAIALAAALISWL